MGSPKTAAPMCMLARRAGRKDCFRKGFIYADKSGSPACIEGHA